MPLVHKYKQSRDYRWKAGETLPGDTKPAPTSTSDGACYGISVFWIRENAAGRDFFQWLGASQVAILAAPPDSTNWQDHSSKAGPMVAHVKEAMQQQSMAIKDLDNHMGDLAKGELAIRLVTEASPLKAIKDEDGLLKSFLPKDPGKWVGELKAEPGFKFISFSGYSGLVKEDMNHAITVLVDPAGCKLFDPNIGEFHAADLGELLNDIVAVMKFYDIRLNRAYFVTFR